MNLPAQNQPRLLPFDRESPGAWQRWEGFWEDFLNANPLLPWPGKHPRFKRSKLAEPWGVGGGSQDGIDIRAHMKDGTILGVQCKNWKAIDLPKVKKAMDKAEREFEKAQAYFLVFTAEKISNKIQQEAERRGNWKIIGRAALSSWFFAGKFLNVEEQKRLVERHFGIEWLRKLFPQPWDELLIPPSEFFGRIKRIRHDAQLQGMEFKTMVEALAIALGEGKPRISILSAPGGYGKTRLLKAVAEAVESNYPQRKVRFLNDSAGAEAEDYGMRGADFKELCLFIDDAHRLENVRKHLLGKLHESATACVMIAARPNNIRALEARLEECGFREGDWQKCEVPVLDRAGRRALAVEILEDDDGRTPDLLAAASERCLLICTVGAELIRTGGIESEILKSEEFRRRVFDHLMVSSLDHLFSNDPEYRKISELCLRSIALLSPLNKSDAMAEFLARVIEGKVVDVDPIISRLEEVGLLRSGRGTLRVAPDLLSDHLVYDTAYGNGRRPTVVRNLIEFSDNEGFTMIFANLAEAEWRARQEGKKDAFLAHMWEFLREILGNSEDQRIIRLLNSWGKIAIFQPERTLELAQIVLNHETDRIARNSLEVRFKGDRYDSISLYLGKLPDILAPVAMHHQDHRAEAFDLLWQIGRIKDSPTSSQDELPAAWQTIARTASLAHWEKCGPQDAFLWLKNWAQRTDGRVSLEKGRSFFAKVASQWFSQSNRRWKEVEAARSFSEEIRDFRHEVLNWIETDVLPAGLGHGWVALQVIISAGNLRPRIATEREGVVDSLAVKSLELLGKVLTQYEDPLIRLTVWQYLSNRVAYEDQDAAKAGWLALRNTIARDLPFELVRLASSFAIHEWNHEQLQKRERIEDYDFAKQWWPELALQTVSELRRAYPTIRQSLEQLDQAERSLTRFRKRASWDSVAEAWSKQFPEERSGVLDQLMAKPEHALVPCLGYFIGLRDEIDCELAEQQTLAALSHADDHLRRAALHRLSWRDVKRREKIAECLNGLAASDDPAAVAAIAGFISWIQFEATPYLEGVLLALNASVLSSSDLARVAEAVAYLIEFAKQSLTADLLQSFLRRLEQEEDLNAVFPDHVWTVFHEKFPVEMFQVHLKRVRAGKCLPRFIDGWFLSGLPEHLGHPEYEKTARDLFDETIRADDDQFCLLSELFDLSVARVKPVFAAELLLGELRKQPREERTLKRIVKLTGAGHGSVVYDVPEFTKELLKEIDLLLKPEAKELRSQLLYAAVPHSWSSCGGDIDEEYLWAKKRAAPLAEHFRSEPLLRDFYLGIVKFQEDEEARERRWHFANESL